MLTISSATALLANPTAALDTILMELGFSTPPLPLPDSAHTQLALPAEVTEAHIARSHGSLRALIVTVSNTPSLRETIQTIAAYLTSRVPHLLWLIIAKQDAPTRFAIATWASHTPRPRIAALICTPDHILDSDAETLCELASTPSSPLNDALIHSRWLEALGREAITRRFYRAIEHSVRTLATALDPSPPPDVAHTIALLYTSRLLFLAFLETKSWLNNDVAFLINSFATCMTTGGSYHRKVLDPLFFGTLNTRPHARATRAHQFGKIPFLNGGLFSRTLIERRFRHSTFPDDALGALFGDVLARYRLTAREDTAMWSEAAIDPEMLGRVFESLMAPPERKSSGAFYTPHALVESVTHYALIEALQTSDLSREIVTHALTGELPDNHTRGLLLDHISQLRILDPACGSGAFLVHALEQLATLRAHLGDIRPISAIRRSILTTSLYGVDINPTAVWLCELRLWLSVVIDNTERDPMRVLPLPNLDHQIRAGDSLASGTFDGTIDLRTARSITELRHKYARATGPRKKSLARLLDRTERDRALAQIDRTLTQYTAQRRDFLGIVRSRNLFAERHNQNRTIRHHLTTLRTQIRHLRTLRRTFTDGAALPFAFATHFPDVADSGGFDVVFGNPPWVRIHHIIPSTRSLLRETFTTFRTAAWRAGAAQAKAGHGFAAQVDLAALFLERATDLLAPHGSLALLLPAKLWRALAGGGSRQLIRTRLRLTALEDFTESPPAFEAATYPSLLVANRYNNQQATDSALSDDIAPPDTSPNRVSSTNATFVVHRRTEHIEWHASSQSLALDTTPGSPWLLLPPSVRQAFDTVARTGTPLARSSFGRPLLGVKSGCNDAFIVRANKSSEEPHTKIFTSTREGMIEQSLLRPLIRGATIRPWQTPSSGLHIIWPHNDDGTPLRTLPPLARRWLTPWRKRLERRSDSRARSIWWNLFRTECAHTQHARVVWSDFGRVPRATLLEPGDPTIPLNTCYVVPCITVDDAYALIALLNAPLIAAWLNAVAEPAHGGYHRYLGWTMSLLPIPQNWPAARAHLAPFTKRALDGDIPSLDELHGATLHAYRLPSKITDPLLAWNTR